MRADGARLWSTGQDAFGARLPADAREVDLAGRTLDGRVPAVIELRPRVPRLFVAPLAGS